MSTYKIYSLKNYQITRDKNNEPQTPFFIGSAEQITKELKNNKGYHQLLKQDTNYILYGDVDHIPDLKIFYEILELIAEYLNIELSTIKYCGNNKTENNKTVYSFHFTIPELNGTIQQQRQIFSDIKNKNTLLCQYLDIGVYANNKWFRLPGQTNEIKKSGLSLLNCTMEQQIIEHIPKESKNILNCGFSDKGIKEFQFNKQMIFNVTNDEIKYLLELLPSIYLNDYHKWIIISNICKGLKCYKIWNNWSANSENYNHTNNNYIWRNIKNVKYDVNYLVHIINNETNNQVEFIKSFKRFEPLTKEYDAEIKNKNYVSEILTYSDFKENQTIILKSCTGTGKTTAMAKHCKTYISEPENDYIKIISLSDKITLCNQHAETFKNENIHLCNYKDGFKKSEHMSICVNSLLQLEHLTNNDFNKYIIFIDEVNSFLGFTHNSTITQIKRIYTVLLRIIKNCKKLILADNIICDNVFEFIKNRFNGTYKFIVNDFQRFQNVEAIHVKNENNFYELIQNSIKQNKPFLFGCDSCATIENYYYKAISNFTKEEAQEKFILITANSKFNIGNASETFKNKFVFFSPSIITAVDFSVIENQNVFIYIKGNTIDALASFQQATRCRNINTLFYYCNEKFKAPKYNSLVELENLYISYINTAEQLREVCEVLNEETTDININENTFFKLFCYNEYNADIFKTNRLKHFQNILKTAKFKLISLDDLPEKIDNSIKNDMKIKKLEINETLFNDFIETENKDIIKYEVLNERLCFLNLPDDKIIISKYQHLLTDEYKMNDYLNFIRFLKTDDYINVKLNKLKTESYNVKIFESPYFKINLVRQLETQFNISPLDINYKMVNKVDIPNEKWDLIKKVFRTEKTKPYDMIQFKPAYIGMLKNICGSDIIKSNRKRGGGDKETYYYFNLDVIQEHLKLNQYINPSAADFKAEYTGMFNIKPNLELQQQKSKNKRFELLDFFDE
jgi:hypothetical protein